MHSSNEPSSSNSTRRSDNNFLLWLAALAPLSLDLFDHVHSMSNFTEDDVTSIQLRKNSRSTGLNTCTARTLRTHDVATVVMKNLSG